MLFKLEDLKTNLVSKFYPFSKKELIENKDKLNFDRYYLMDNKHIVWDEELLDCFKKELDWTAIWKLSKIDLSIDFFKKYEDLIDFSSIDLSKSFFPSKDILNLYSDRFNKNRLVLNLVDNQLDFIDHHKENLDWDRLSRTFNFKQSDEVVTRYEDLWNWNLLSTNKSLPTNASFIHKFKDKLSFRILSKNPSFFYTILKNPNYENWNWRYFMVNPKLEWNIEIEEFLKPRIEFKMNPVFKRFDLIYSQIINFLIMCEDNRVNYFLVDKYLKHVSFESLSKSRININPIFFHKHKDKIDFANQLLIHKNKDMISMKYILDNPKRFDWKYGHVTRLNINQGFLKKYPYKFSWFDLSGNTFFDWDWNFIEKNIENLHLHRLSLNTAVFDCFMKSSSNDFFK